MDFERFIAGRLFHKSGSNFSKPIIRLSVFSVALGLAVMIISAAILSGFQREIKTKIFGFGAHIRISAYEMNTSQEPQPINKNQSFVDTLSQLTGVRHVQAYAEKAGIIKTADQIEGVVLKGIGKNFDWSYFNDKMLQGSSFRVSDTSLTNDIIISKVLADRLHIKLNDHIRMYFVNNDEMQPRGRKFHVQGIFETGLKEFDQLYLFGDIGHIRKLNKWGENDVGGFEIYISDDKKMDDIADELYDIVPYDLDVKTIRQLQPQIFEWLRLQDINVIIILVLIVLVAAITMISTLLILILEKTNMIGILKALGATTKSIRRIFIYHVVYITGKGLLWGNVIALGLALLQLNTGLVKLNQESYYVSVVPIHLQLSDILTINAGTLIICTLMVLIPSLVIARIAPLKAIRYD